MVLTDDFVASIVARMFPAAVSSVMAVLSRYESPEHTRVRVACLKLADGDLAKLDATLTAACRDYRDVLAWAEYPQEMATPTWNATREEAAAVRDADRAQYEGWLRAMAARDEGWSRG